MEIRQLDILVHPDFSGLNIDGIRDPREVTMRPLWDQRIEAIAMQPDAALLYYSTFPSGLRYDILYPEESERRARCQSSLGDRLILFDRLQLPDKTVLLLELNKRDLFFNRRDLHLTAYGQYYNHCVKTWLSYVQKALGLPDENCSREPALCIGVHPELKIFEPSE